MIDTLIPRRREPVRATSEGLLPGITPIWDTAEGCIGYRCGYGFVSDHLDNQLSFSDEYQRLATWSAVTKALRDALTATAPYMEEEELLQQLMPFATRAEVTVAVRM